jgi:hypothetical protein
VHCALATGRLRSTDEVAVFGTHPYKRSSRLARGFPDSHVEEQHCRPSRLLLVPSERLVAADRDARSSTEAAAADKARPRVLPASSGPRLGGLLLVSVVQQ